MASKQRHPLLQYLRKLTGAPGVRELTDRQLLERFAAERDETAFDMLVQRHGPMVWGVCRRILHQDTDADDAFQATFLVLARKAGSLRWPESVGSWLYGVAHRVALKARVQTARRGERERRAVGEPHADPMAEITGRELQQVVDEELLRLPARYRAPLVLCYLEGKTRDEAAELLGWTVGSVKGRLERARQLLEKRLTRRGLAFSTALLAALLVKSSATAAVPAALKAAAVQAGIALAAGQTAGAVSAPALILANGALRAMFLAKLKVVLAVALAVGVLGAGAGVAVYRASGTTPIADDVDTQPPPVELAATETLAVDGAGVAVPTPRAEPPAPEEVPAPQVGDRDRNPPQKAERKDERKPKAGLRAPIRRVDEAKGTLTIAYREQADGPRGDGASDRTLDLAPDALVELLDDWGVESRDAPRPGKLADLGEGVMVTISLAPDEKTVVRVRAEPLTVRGTLAAVDVDGSQLTVTSEGRNHRYEVSPLARVTIEGKPGALADLRAGTPITLKLLLDSRRASFVIQNRAIRDGDREK